ncbi:hypothetical protein HanRHA438_Chr03g0111501 [Helianthus annuus]|nr:hypothetical protein HanHA300_Chr03g0083671 [Helianthus annuus]KAJ0607305.1 hypothetical protein HanHA89_Chr03g0095141 [Helianthus annuus]KAJ0767365.1 hypothetical protein HanLR1_Chr03g0088441 [Helianthus annuus]KAJ0934782.1 hypothetical protein HanRHA438_Chr03g0111501 [Helianthus annuus]
MQMQMPNRKHASGRTILQPWPTILCLLFLYRSYRLISYRTRVLVSMEVVVVVIQI